MSKRVVPLARLIAWATRHGVTRTSAASFRWKISGNCEAPHVTEFVGRPTAERCGHPVYREAGQGEPAGVYLDLETRCRECASCLRQRASLWRLRAKTEIERAARTWFGTLTVGPDYRFRYDTECRMRQSQSGGDFDTLPESEKFAERHRQVSSELTLWLKRLRKATNAPLKYFIVAEAHVDGWPHIHMLVHEQDAGRPIRHAQVSAGWPAGFVMWKLVDDPRAGSYLCKYLSKSLAARVRASQAYGASEADIAARRVSRLAKKNTLTQLDYDLAAAQRALDKHARARRSQKNVNNIPPEGGGYDLPPPDQPSGVSLEETFEPEVG